MNLHIISQFFPGTQHTSMNSKQASRTASTRLLRSPISNTSHFSIDLDASTTKITCFLMMTYFSFS